MFVVRRCRISTLCRRYFPTVLLFIFISSLLTLLRGIPDIHHTGSDEKNIRDTLSHNERLNLQDREKPPLPVWQPVVNTDHGKAVQNNNHQFGRGLLDKVPRNNGGDSESYFRARIASNRNHRDKLNQNLTHNSKFSGQPQSNFKNIPQFNIPTNVDKVKIQEDSANTRHLPRSGVDQEPSQDKIIQEQSGRVIHRIGEHNAAVFDSGSNSIRNIQTGNYGNVNLQNDAVRQGDLGAGKVINNKVENLAKTPPPSSALNPGRQVYRPQQDHKVARDQNPPGGSSPLNVIKERPSQSSPVLEAGQNIVHSVERIVGAIHPHPNRPQGLSNQIQSMPNQPQSQINNVNIAQKISNTIQQGVQPGGYQRSLEKQQGQQYQQSMQQTHPAQQQQLLQQQQQLQQQVQQNLLKQQQLQQYQQQQNQLRFQQQGQLSIVQQQQLQNRFLAQQQQQQQQIQTSKQNVKQYQEEQQQHQKQRQQSLAIQQQNKQHVKQQQQQQWPQQQQQQQQYQQSLAQQQQNHLDRHQPVLQHQQPGGQPSQTGTISTNHLPTSQKGSLQHTSLDIVWSPEIDEAVSEGYTWEEVDEWSKKVRTHQVKVMATGSETKCGRPPNQYLEMDDDMKLCARYRDMHIIEIEGELLSFYLGRLLDIRSVPPLVLSKLQSNSSQWSQQRSKLAEAKWENEEIVSLTKFFDGLSRAWLPKTLIKFQDGAPLEANSPELKTLSLQDLSYLAQWSDLIVFDYIIGHIDRITNHQEGIIRHDKAVQRSIWSNQPIHNLAYSKSTSTLWFIDNETGLRMAYRTLYHNNVDGEKYRGFHDAMLHSICLFRPGTVEKISQLYNHPNPVELLMKIMYDHEPLAKNVRVDSPGTVNDLPDIFKMRVGSVYQWMQKCRQRLNQNITN